ncbi:MAG TPA: hypothetical protein VD996_13270 [Chitinophagaceae bacterium]|nr:hypothetical protein [Chitinophagaceae bacterium]
MEMINTSQLSELYKTSRGQIEHITNNLAQRVIWLVIAQSFFFSGFSVLINGKPLIPHLQPVWDALSYIFPIAALLTVAFTFIDVLTSFNNLRDIRLKYENHCDPEEARTYPLIHGTQKQRIFQHAAPMLLPIMFIVVWGIVLFVQHSHPPGSVPAPPPQAQQQQPPQPQQ